MNCNIIVALLLNLIFSIFLFSCTNIEDRYDEDKSIYSINIHEIDASPSLSFDDVFLWSKSIPLTFDDETVIGEISKVSKSGDYFYVLDNKTHSLYEFNSIGKKTKKFGEVGQGPGEYIRIDDFLIDSVNRQMVVLSNEGRAGIYFYDLVTSNFIKKINVNIFPLNFCKYGDDFLIYTSKNPSDEGEFDVFRVDTVGSILDRFMSYKIDVPVILPYSGFLKKTGENIFYAPLYDEQVYMFDNVEEAFIPYMRITINNDYIEKNKSNPMEIFKSQALLDENTSFLMSSYESNDSYTLLTYQQNRGLGLVVYKNGRQEMIQITPESLKKDIRYRLINVFRPYSLSENNQVIFSIDPAQIQKEKKQIQPGEDISKEINELFEGDNVVDKDRHYLVIAEINL